MAAEEAKVIALPPREYRRVVEAVQNVLLHLSNSLPLFAGEAQEDAYRLLLRLMERLLTAEDPKGLFPAVQAFVDALAGISVIAAKPAAPAPGTAELEGALARLKEELQRVTTAAARERESLARNADASDRARRLSEDEARGMGEEVKRLRATEERLRAEAKETARTAEVRESAYHVAKKQAHEGQRRIAELEASLAEARRNIVEARDEIAAEITRATAAVQTARQESAGLRQRLQEAEARLPEIDRLKVELDAARKDQNARAEVLTALAAARVHLADELGRVDSLASRFGAPAPVPAASAFDPKPLEAEIARRGDYLVRLIGAAGHLNSLRMEAEQAIAELQVANEVAPDAERHALIRRTQAKLGRIAPLLKDVNFRREEQSAARKRLNQIIDAHAVMSQGVPDGLLGIELVPIDDAAIAAIEETADEEESDGRTREQRLRAQAEPLGFSPEVALMLVLYEAVPKLVPQLAPPRVARAAEAAGILRAYGWENGAFRQAFSLAQARPQSRDAIVPYLRYRGSPNRGEDSMTFQRTVAPLPWTMEEVLSLDELAAFREQVALKEPRK